MPQIEKRKVTMTSISLAPDGQTVRHEATDYVPVDILDAYVADANTRWQSVAVDHEGGHNAGPGGDDGDTHYPPHLIGG